MPLTKHFSRLELARDLRAFFRLEAGVIRGEVPDYERRLEEKNLQIRKLQTRLKSKNQEIADLRRQMVDNASGVVNPENIVWIFGTARTGSTWLGSMMKSLPEHVLWNEPWLGEIFGSLQHRTNSWEYKRRRKDFILSHHYEQTSLKSIRNFTLEAIRARFSKTLDGGYVVVKEPHGSMGAPMLMQAFPESRMIFLVRDPRDVAASGIAAHLKGGWALKNKDNENSGAVASADSISAAQTRARMYRRDVNATKEAFEAHEGRKALVRYEDLKSEPLETTKRIYSSLEIPVDQEQLERAVEQLSWTNLPGSEKGEGKARRKAAPGSWGEDLSEEQVKEVERITSPLLKEFYPESVRHTT